MGSFATLFFERSMTGHPSEDRELRTQIEEATTTVFSTEGIEARIAQALLSQGEFYENIDAADLEIILRNIVYVMFSRQTVAGRDIDILHNVPIMRVEINEEQAHVEFIVHIHKPIIVFIEFEYTLINHPDENEKRLCLKEGSLRIKEKTRRFDVKAKASLTAMNVPKIARQEMSDMTEVIRRTLPAQLQRKGVTGELKKIRLSLNEHTLCVYLMGEFEPLVETA
jgi:hypothetical protein